MRESNVWKVYIQDEDDETDDYEFFIEAGPKHTDALAVLEQVSKEYLNEGWTLIKLEYLGTVYLTEEAKEATKQ